MQLLERDSLLAALSSRLSAAADGSGSIVMIAGEAGAGKSALVEAFCLQSATAATVVWGSCDAMLTASPLGPLHDMARGGGPLGDLLATDAPRQRVFQAVLDMLSTPGRPVIAVFEDLHWADEATVDLVVFLGRRVVGTRGLVLVTFRDEPAATNPLRNLLGAVAARSGVHRLEVPSLSREAVGVLAAEHEVDPYALHALTAGNPFFVTEVLAAPGAAVPTTVRDAVLARVQGLSTRARQALEAAAAIPNQIEIGLLRSVADVDDSAIDECERSGVLRGDGRRLWFRHELSRIAIERSTPVATRTGIHARVLAYLSAQPGADTSRLAYHAEEAGDGAAVLVHAPQAAARAKRLGAHREAVAQYARALRFADAMTPRERAELLENFAVECRGTNRMPEAIDASSQALAIWASLGERERQAELFARHSLVLWSAGRNEEGYRASAESVALLDQGESGPALAAALTYHAYLRMLARDIPAAIEVGRRAIALTESFGRQRELALALNAVGTAQWFVSPREAEQTLARSLAVARESDDDEATTAALVNLGSGAGEVRRYDAADRWLGECFAWCAERDLDTNRLYSLSWIARVGFEQGRWEAATKAATEAGDRATSYLAARIVALTVVGRLRVRRGDPDPDEPLTEAWSLAEQSGDLQRLWPVAAARAEAAWLAGRPHEVPGMARETFEMALRLRHSWAIGELGYWLWKAGALPEPPPDAAEPFALQMAGEPLRAAQCWREIGCPYESAIALAEVGSPESLAEAYQEMDRLGAWPAAQAIASRLRELGVSKVPRRPRRATLANLGRLTARELEVLHLLALDLRNADVAARLHISAKTVDHHVSAILGKLGVATRRDAAARLLAAQDGEPVGEI